MITNRIKGIGLALGIGFVVAAGFVATSGQYVPGGGGGGGGTVYSAGNGLALAGSVFALRTDCAAGERQEWDGAAWQCREPADYRSKHLEWSDDFLFSTCPAQGSCGSMWTLLVSGTGAGPTNIGASQYRPGVLSFTTGTTATGRCQLVTNNVALDFGSYTDTTYEASVGFPTLSTSTDGYAGTFGFADNQTGIDHVDGCWFVYDERAAAAAPTTGSKAAAGTNVWQCAAAAAGVKTQYPMDGSTVSDESFTTVNEPVGALTLPGTNIYDLAIVETTTAGTATRCEYYVNKVKACDIATHLPSGTAQTTGAILQVVKNVGTTSRSFYVDRTRLAIDLATARSL